MGQSAGVQLKLSFAHCAERLAWLGLAWLGLGFSTPEVRENSVPSGSKERQALAEHVGQVNFERHGF